MKRTNIVPILPSKQQMRILKTIGDHCATLLNAVKYRYSQAFFKGEPVSSYETLCSGFKESPAYKACSLTSGRRSAKSTERMGFVLRLSASLLQRQGGRASPHPAPLQGSENGQALLQSRTRQGFDVVHAYFQDLKAHAVQRALQQQRGDRLCLPTRGLLKSHGQPKTLEVKQDPVKKRWCACQVVEVPHPVKKARPIEDPCSKADIDVFWWDHGELPRRVPLAEVSSIGLHRAFLKRRKPLQEPRGFGDC